jgi:hypothetical protein
VAEVAAPARLRWEELPDSAWFAEDSGIEALVEPVVGGRGVISGKAAPDAGAGRWRWYVIRYTATGREHLGGGTADNRGKAALAAERAWRRAADRAGDAVARPRG